MKIGKIATIIMMLMVATLAITALSQTSEAKSLYVCSNTNSNDAPIQAYNINPNGSFTYQAEYITGFGWGSVGLAVDSNTGFLFLTREMSGELSLINGTTMTGEGTVTAPGATDLAGVVYDHDKELLYTVDRYTPYLYAYDWDPVLKNLTLLSGYPIDLNGTNDLYGIALDEDNDILYASNMDNVTYYDTDTWNLIDTIELSHACIGIGVDYKNQYLYTGAAWDYDYYFTKYDLNTETETAELLDDGVMGIAIDQSSGLVYTTTGFDDDQLIAWDTSTTPFTKIDETEDIGDPAGLCIPIEEVSYNPLNLNKHDGLEEGSCITPGSSLTYTISYDNSMNENDVHNITIIDDLPTEVTYTSSSDGGTYDSTNHTVTWNIGTLSSGASTDSVTATVQVKPSTAFDITFTNYATIESDETPPTTRSEQTMTCEGSGEDTTPPIQTVELGTPLIENEYYTGTEWLDLIGSQTPVWINSTDTESGTDFIKYKLFKSDTYGNWNDPPWVYVYDNQDTGDPATTDSDPTVGRISIEFTIQESCFHEIHAHCVDMVGNWNTSDPLDFLVDYDPPSNHEFSYIGSYVLPGGSRYINNETIKRIYANDTGCTEGVAGVNRIVWRIENTHTVTIASGIVYDNNETGYEDDHVIVSGDLDMTDGKMVIDIQLKEKCRHYIYHQAIDNLENKESGRKELVYVDLTPPTINKTVGEPNCEVETGVEYCITNETSITFNATDLGCFGGVGLDTLCYRIWNMTHGWTDWMEVTKETTIYIPEECTHYLEIRAVDYLENMITDNETFHVDLQPPTIIKTVGDPHCELSGDGPDMIPTEYVEYFPDGAEAFCVTTATELNLDAIDNGCCTSTLTIEYKMWKADEDEPDVWMPYTGNFTFDEECRHYLLVRAYDCLDNGKYEIYDWDLEIFYVDDQAPEIHKTVGDPNCTIIPGEEYCITSDTPIYVNATNMGCCPSEYLMVQYKINDGDWIPLMLPGIIDLPEECTHTLTIKAWDCLNNTATDIETFHVDNSHPELMKTVGEPNCPQPNDCTMISIPDEGTIELQYLGTYAYFDAFLSNIPKGYDLINGSYRAWCFDQNHTIGSGIPYDIDLYCSYDSEIPWPDEDWDNVNYLINHKHPNATVMQIQRAIWYFINGGVYPSSSIAQSMVDDAEENGDGFVPQEGEYCAILCDTGDDNQKIFIEYRIPEMYCVTTSTEITLDGMDYPGCCTEDVMIEYKMWSATEPMPEEWMMYTDPITFDSECKHYLLVRISDCLGHGINDPYWDLEIFYVDDQAPEIHKTVGDPNCTIIPGEEYCIKTTTPITIDVENMGCCIDEEIMLRYKINDGEWIELAEWPMTIYMEEECNHTLTIEAWDCLENKATDVELFHVDDTPPTIIKEVGDPHCGPECEIPDYLPQDFEFTPRFDEEGKDFVGGLITKSMDEEHIYFDIIIDENPQYTHTEFQLVFSEYSGDGEEFLPQGTLWKVGVDNEGSYYTLADGGIDTDEDGIPDSPHTGYGWWFNAEKETLPEGISIDGDVGDFTFKVTIDREFIGDCGEKYYWGAVIGAAWPQTGSSATRQSQYPGPETWQLWKCKGEYVYNMNGIEAYCVTMDTNITLDTIDPGCCDSDVTIEYMIYQPDEEETPGISRDIRLPMWQTYNGTPINFEEECMHYLLVRAYDCLENGKYDMHYWDAEIFYVDEQGPSIHKEVGDPKVKLEDDTHGHDQWMIFPETDICLSIDPKIPDGCCPNETGRIEYRYWYLGEWTDWMEYTDECIHLTEGCVHYLEARAIDCLGNIGPIDNETFWVCGPSGETGPSIKFIEPGFGEERCDRTLEVIIEAEDDETAKEDLNVIMWIPGGRRDAPTLYYYPEYNPAKYGDEYFHAFIDIYKYQDSADLTLQAIAQDEDMNTEITVPQQFKVCSTIVWDQWMQKGWNSLTLPFGAISCDNSPEKVLASVIDYVEVIYWYDGDEWWDYVPDFSWNWPEFSTLHTGETYWIKITKEDGLRYFTDTHAPMVSILNPMDEATVDFSDLPLMISGDASDVETGIDQVMISIYDNETGEYWNGTDWVMTETMVMCMGTENWHYNLTSDAATGHDHELIITAKAYDHAGCYATDMISFELFDDLSVACPEGSGATIDPDYLEVTMYPGQSIDELKTITTDEIPIGKLDVMFLFDLTSSMSGQLSSAKANAISIMNDISGRVNDSAFGVGSFMDYTDYYSYCGYSGNYGSEGYGDYPWSLDQDITDDTSSINSAINGLILGGGSDGPESYTRALWESQFASWRVGARKIVVIFGDNIPHDCNLDEISDASSTGPDPGRNETAGDDDDLTWSGTAADLKNAGISVVAVHNLYSTTQEQIWGYMTDETGGILSEYGSASELPDQILDLIENVTGTINYMTLQPSAGYEDWFSWTPENHTEVPGNTTVEFDVDITVPADAEPGNHHICLLVIGDGAILAVQELDIYVEECLNIVEMAVSYNPEEFNTLVEAVLAAGLDGVLSNLSNEFTVFAPIDAAFDALDPVVLNDLIENDTANLTDILTYHVVPGTYMSGDLSDGMMLTTVQGEDLEITVNGSGVFVNDAMVLIPDVVCCNGVIHAIDTVLFPPDCPIPEFTNIELLQSTDETSWTDMTKEDGYEFAMELHPENDYHYIDINNTGTTTNTTLIPDHYGFLLETTDLPTDFYDYWNDKGVYEGCTGTWEPYMWDIINGTSPMFYLNVSETEEMMLLDGLQYQLGDMNAHLRVSGDYPEGYYNFTGTIVNSCGEMMSDPITITIFFFSMTEPTCEVHANITYPMDDMNVSTEPGFTINGNASSTCSCIREENVSIYVFYQVEGSTYYYNETSDMWDSSTVIWNPVTKVSGGCPSSLIDWNFTIDSSLISGETYTIRVKAIDDDGVETQSVQVQFNGEMEDF